MSGPETPTAVAPLTLRLGGVGIALSAEDPAWLAAASQRFASFLAEGEPRFTIELITDATAGRAEPAPDPAVSWRRRDGDEEFSVVVPGLAVGADLRRSRGWVRGVPSADCIEALLRHLLPALVPDGFVLHAAGIADAAGAWACCGASGAGKSTLAALAAEHALCEEAVAIRCVGDRFFLDSLPLRPARAASLPLRGICCLRHAPVHCRTRIDSAAAVRRLAKVVLWPSYSRTAMGRIFAAYAEVAQRCPIFDLGFASTPDVWEALAGASRDV
jgi:hypothetical protein